MKESRDKKYEFSSQNKYTYECCSKFLTNLITIQLIDIKTECFRVF